MARCRLPPSSARHGPFRPLLRPGIQQSCPVRAAAPKWSNSLQEGRTGENAQRHTQPRGARPQQVPVVRLFDQRERRTTRRHAQPLRSAKSVAAAERAESADGSVVMIPETIAMDVSPSVCLDRRIPPPRSYTSVDGWRRRDRWHRPNGRQPAQTPPGNARTQRGRHLTLHPIGETIRRTRSGCPLGGCAEGLVHLNGPCLGLAGNAS